MPTIANLTKQPFPKLPWNKAKKKILGKNYNLSVVLCGKKRLRSLNKKYRQKNKAAKVLSFSYAQNEGEIFLAPDKKTKELFYLYIHSLLHLKGYEHGQKMELLEKKYYNIQYGA